ncbi:MAG: Rpn family recombination-promoting nuclease/putative transposase [Algicola sp.]|nr:Rpn family recombination-promoting nuclease/putative transposase [Algicola sp.]
MQNASIAQQFFQQYLPHVLSSALSLDAFEYVDATYIDATLQETFSDLVYRCPYKNSVNGEAKVILLVEHQSTPDKLIAFRVYHYLFNMLYKELKARPKSKAKNKLPAVFAMVFYNGKQTPYPYSLQLADCFDDPLKIMGQVLQSPLPLIDVNQVHDNELKKQQLLGIMTGAMKHCRERDVAYYLLDLMKNLNPIDLSSDLALEFIKTTANYVFKADNPPDFESLQYPSDLEMWNPHFEVTWVYEKFRNHLN